MSGIAIAKLVFDVVTYIFTAVIGALGGAKLGAVATKKKISNDPTNNYTYKK